MGPAIGIPLCKVTPNKLFRLLQSLIISTLKFKKIANTLIVERRWHFSLTHITTERSLGFRMKVSPPYHLFKLKKKGDKKMMIDVDLKMHRRGPLVHGFESI